MTTTENCLSVDRTALPTALLDLAKSHLRVRHTRDDVLIGVYLGQALDAVERMCNINLNPSTFALGLERCVLVPCADWPASMRLVLPVNNVTAFTLVDGEGVDQAGNYTIEQADLGGSASSYLVGPAIPAATPGWTMTADCGVDDPDQLSPAVLAAVLRLAGGYYENRESPAALIVDEYRLELAAVWRPTA
jgi:uncharacterized phiE125 gp8 family phage protein